MAHCRYCGKRGLLVAVNVDGLCGDCQVEILQQVPQVVRIINESEKIIESSKNWKTRLSRCDDIDQFLKRFESYAERGIEVFSQPLRDCLQEDSDRRMNVIEETVQSLFEAATTKAETAATPRTRIPGTPSSLRRRGG